MRIRLLESLLFEGKEKQAGDVIDVSEQEAKILVMIKRAIEAEDGSVVSAKTSRRSYKRRDMRAENRQYGVK